MALSEEEIRERDRSRAIRGYIIRCLIRSCNNMALTKHLSNSLFIQQAWESGVLYIAVSFKLNDGTGHEIKTSLNRIGVEIIDKQ